MEAPHRDLASIEVWEKSLVRSRRRRELAVSGRREPARKKKASAAVTAAMAVAPTAPAFAATVAGTGSAPNVEQSSPANRAIAPAAPSQLLRMGSTGPDVTRLQGALNVQTDGIFGPETDAAVRAFQQRAGLTADGIVGPETWRSVFTNVSGASLSTPRYAFSIERASQSESAQVSPAVGRGPEAKITVRSVPTAQHDTSTPVAAPAPQSSAQSAPEGTTAPQTTAAPAP